MSFFFYPSNYFLLKYGKSKEEKVCYYENIFYSGGKLEFITTSTTFLCGNQSLLAEIACPFSRFIQKLLSFLANNFLFSESMIIYITLILQANFCQGLGILISQQEQNCSSLKCITGINWSFQQSYSLVFFHREEIGTILWSRKERLTLRW